MTKNGLGTGTIKAPSVKRWVVFGDVHLEALTRSGQRPIDRHDPTVISLFLQFIKDFKPDGIVCLGDLAHMGPISHFQAGRGMRGRIAVHTGEFEESYLEDSMGLCNLFLDYMQEATPKTKDITVLEGNHELWLRQLRNHPDYKSVRDDLWYPEKNWRLKERGMKYRTFERYEDFCRENFAMIGNRAIIHGWFITQNFLEKTSRLIGCPYMQGDVHKAEFKMFGNTLDGRIMDAYSVGCMCTKEASYNRGRLNGWSQGWSVVYQKKDGNTLVQNIPVVGKIAVFDKKVYTSKTVLGLM